MATERSLDATPAAVGTVAATGMAHNGTPATMHFIWGAIERSEDDSSGPLPSLGPGQDQSGNNWTGTQANAVIFLDDHTSSQSGQDVDFGCDSDAGKRTGPLRAATDDPPKAKTFTEKAHDHALGVCSPCRFAARSTGCRHGDDCAFCHFPHLVQLRPRKKKRNACKHVVSCLDALTEEERQCLDKMMENNTSTSLYLRALVRKKLQGKLAKEQDKAKTEDKSDDDDDEDDEDDEDNEVTIITSL